METDIEAFIFGVGGVISNDSAEYHFRSWQQLAEEKGIPFNRQDNDQLRGVSRQECLKTQKRASRPLPWLASGP